MVLNRRLFCSVFIFLFATGLFATKVPQLKGYVNDYANVVSASDEREMVNYLSALENTTGIQIAVLTMPSLEGDDIASFAIRVVEEWKLGQKGKDKGALLLLSMEERDLRIEVGDGLEDKLTDVKCGLILRNVIIPEFRANGYSSGLLKGVKNMSGIASDNVELISPGVRNEVDEDSDVEGVIALFIWLFIFFMMISSRSGLFKWILFNQLLGGRRHRRGFTPTYKNRSNFGGSFGGFGGGSRGFGGGSGGGFHGGGGHFSGGGASAHF